LNLEVLGSSQNGGWQDVSKEPGVTFKTWLLLQKNREDSVGDLARDALKDRAWPPTQDMVKLRAHLVKQGVVEKIRLALEEAYSEYQKQGDRQRPAGIG
jgi:uncharacterized protein YozE (UPF0346 family)